MVSNAAALEWSHSAPYNALAPMGTQDFTNLADLDVNFDFDFLSDFAHTHGADPRGKHAGAGDSSLFATSTPQQLSAQARQNIAQGSPMFDMPMPMNYTLQNAQPFNAMQNGHNALGLHQMAPPTPNSVEMHANTARYIPHMDAQQRAIMEHYHMSKPDSMNNLTPLGTPAVTPYEFMSNDYTVPGAYFSPLASPMLDGQHRNGHHTSASSVATSSPIDHDVDMVGDLSPQAEFVSKKPTRKASRTPRLNGNRKVAQSPIQKSQRKKTAISAIQSRDMNELLEATQHSHLSPTSPRNSRMHQGYSTGSDSISPEPLSEVMGPPPKPASAKPSPAILGTSPNFLPTGHIRSPATPASLMRLQPSGEATGAITAPPPLRETETDVPMLEELALPEAVISAPKRPSVSRIDTASASRDAAIRMGARKVINSGINTPIVPSSGPTVARPPIHSALTSPADGVASPVLSKQGSKTRIAKKRGSMSSNIQLSPAIRPKISSSPNIQPLLPGGGPGALTDQERTTFLASRSNYQNLIEGTSIPGVSYPSDLPTQLTSKRTSHKIAEQGRRQRINIALQKMQQLLPKSLPGDKKGENDDEDDDDDDDAVKRKTSASGGGKCGGNSKAATVESAIVYIEQLHLQKKQWDDENAARERCESQQVANRNEIAELRQKVRELEEQLAAAAANHKVTFVSAANESD
ncbi:gb [Venturia nashicola]|nr:gb [Venturia nashicola]